MNQPSCQDPAASQTVTQDLVSVTFDWEPVIRDGCAHFHLGLERNATRSIVDFELNLARCTEAELLRLNQFLVRRHLNATTKEEMAASIYWLVDCSLRQAEPTLTAAERDARLRALLLCEGGPAVTRR